MDCYINLALLLTSELNTVLCPMGYPIEIFDSPPPDSYKCAICHDVLKDPVIIRNCGHSFCHGCLTGLVYNDHRKSVERCPTCRQQFYIESNWVRNYFARDVIESLRVGCLRENIGSSKCIKTDKEEPFPDIRNRCDWKGRCNDLKAHDNVCPFKVVECVFHGCDHKCQRKDMNCHLQDGLFYHMELMIKTHNKEIKSIRASIATKCSNEINTLVKCQNRKVRVLKQKVRASRQKIKSMQIELSRIKYNADRGDEVTVKYCGIKEINGAYRHCPNHGNGTTYMKCVLYNNKDTLFKIFRLGIWYIVAYIDYKEVKDGWECYGSGVGLYYNQSEDNEMPSDGWECHGSGVTPAPRVFFSSMCSPSSALSHEDEFNDSLSEDSSSSDSESSSSDSGGCLSPNLTRYATHF